MAEYLIQGETLNQIADAIRAKTGEEGEMTPVEMPEKIEGIKGLWEQIQDGTLTEWVDDEIITLKAPLFMGYEALKKVSCENLIELPNYVFYGSHIANVYLPRVQNLLSIGSNGYHFANCYFLETIQLPELTTISGQNNFFSCSKLITVSFPKLINLTFGTFQSCKKLTQVELPAVTNIGGMPFLNCASLLNLHLPSLIDLNNGLAENCQLLEKIDLPLLTKISTKAVIFKRCPLLKALILRNESTIVTLSSSEVFDTSDGIGAGIGYIYVPAALIEEYKSATNWSTYATQFRALEDYTVDGTITGELDETKIAEAAE